MNPRDIEIIEKIVSGELTDQERTEQLHHFDSKEPECWRSLALGFVEKQIVRETFAEATEITSPSKKSPLWLMTAASAAMLMIGMALGLWLRPDPSAGSLVEAPTSLQPAEPTLEPRTSYIVAHLENGDQIVLPIRHFQLASH
jgi:hypothetical protein